MLEENSFYARLAQEAELLKREQPSFKPLEDDITKWQGFIIGTEIYEGGVFCLKILIPRDYPYKPPHVTCQTQIFHPNFYRERICIGVLGKDWTATTNLIQIIESIRFLISAPNPHDPLYTIAAELMKKNMKEFKARTKEWVAKYATWSQKCLSQLS